MNSRSIVELARLVEGELRGSGAEEILRIADFTRAAKGEITFLEKPDGVSPSDTQASCVIIPKDCSLAFSCAVIAVENPKLSFAKVAELLHPPKIRSAEIHKSAVIAPSAKIGVGVFVGAFVCIGEDSFVGEGTQIRAGAKIGDGVKVGNNCVIHPNVFLEDGVSIGNNVILHSGVVIGTDGFGYVRDKTEYVKFPQIGTVVIEDEVEIGANTCIDRGALGETRIGRGTKIDNLVQVGHNVRIGARVVIAAQTGISGSTVIEDDCIIGGQVGFGDHAKVLSGAIIGSQAGVLPGKIVRAGIWWGTPVQPLAEFKKQNALLKGIGRLRDEVRELKKRLDEFTNNN